MDDVGYEKTGTSEPATPPVADAPEPEIVEPVKAWLVGYGHVGLINVVAESQEELVERFNRMRRETGSDLQPVQAINTNPEEPDASTIWLDPNKVEMVLEQYAPRGQAAGHGIPPGLEDMIERLRTRDGVEVLVEPEPGDPGSGG